MDIGKDLIEIAKSALPLARPVVDTGCGLINSLFGKPFKVAGGMIADQLYAWRWTNRVRIAARAQEILDEHEVDARILPPGFLMPLLDAAGDVEDPELQELWAQLLASAVSEDENQVRSYVEILKCLSPVEAKLLVAIAGQKFRWRETLDLDPISKKLFRRHGDVDEGTLAQFGCSHDVLEAALSHLNTLGIIVPDVEIDVVKESVGHKQSRRVGERRYTFAKFTPFGKRFFSACSESSALPKYHVALPWEADLEFRQTAQHALSRSSEALDAAEDAQRVADEANNAAEEAKDNANSAEDVAAKALRVVELQPGSHPAGL
jgi:hypothetical protein